MLSNPFLLSFTLLLSLPILFLLAPRLLLPNNPVAPIPAEDELHDLALFNRAASSSAGISVSHHLASSNPKLKIAFLFLTNSDLQFSPLWNRFFRKADRRLYNIYIHADPTVNVSIPGGVFNSENFIVSRRTYRASPTLVSAARRLMANAILDDPANFYFALISQHCIPLHSFKYTYHSLVTSTTFDRSSLSDSLTASTSGIRLEYKSFIEIISRDKKLWKRYVSRGRYAMMPEVPFENFRVGSQFYVLTRKHAVMVIKDRTLWRKFKKPCYRADECYPEEHYFPTLLSMRDPTGCTHYTLTMVNWTGTVNGHPYTYRPFEVSPQLIYQLRQSNHSESYLFARKFSPDCLKPLMKIADSVIFRD